MGSRRGFDRARWRLRSGQRVVLQLMRIHFRFCNATVVVVLVARGIEIEARGFRAAR